MRDLLIYSWKAYNYCRRLKKENEFDLCHAFFGVPCGFIAMVLNIPYIVSLRGSDVPFYNNRFVWLDKLVFRRLSRYIWKKAKKVVALSQDLKTLAEKTAPKQEISVIYNGINTEEFFPGNNSEDNLINILFVGRLIERKGLEYLLEAFKNVSLDYPQARLLIAGDGPLRKKSQDHVDENGLGEKVKFYGIVSHDKINDIYQKSQIFVLPSLNEALGNVTQEALAAGLAMITTKTGAAEIIDDNGIIIEKKSSQSIETALRKLLDDKVLREAMGKKSRELAEKMTWNEIAQKYNTVYKEVC
jgi:glycosyltransferase involved in cell wall biosynthesis